MSLLITRGASGGVATTSFLFCAESYKFLQRAERVSPGYPNTGCTSEKRDSPCKTPKLWYFHQRKRAEDTFPLSSPCEAAFALFRFSILEPSKASLGRSDAVSWIETNYQRLKWWLRDGIVVVGEGRAGHGGEGGSGRWTGEKMDQRVVLILVLELSGM